MTFDERAAVFAELQKEMDRVCHTKSVDYAGKEDMLANFKSIAAKTGLTKYQVWAVYFEKHISAINHSVKHSPDSPQVESEPLLGRIVDAINYLRLFQCMLVEDDLYNKGQTIVLSDLCPDLELETAYESQSAQ